MVFRGDEHDVLGRYLGAARAVDADVILRVTSDCPLIDPRLCAAVIEARADTQADYAANNMPRLFPHGLDCEAFTRAGLEQAASDATEAYDREHVTPWLRRKPDLQPRQCGWTRLAGQPAALDIGLSGGPRPSSPDCSPNCRTTESPPGRKSCRRSARLPDLAQGQCRPPRQIGDGQRSRRRRSSCFRSKANEQIGPGHAMRCNALHDRGRGIGLAQLLGQRRGNDRLSRQQHLRHDR